MFSLQNVVSQWSIRQSIAALLVAVVAVSVTADLLIQKLIISPSFEALEEDEAREAAGRCIKVIDQEVRHLRVFTEDWSAWDDTYQFAADRNAAYIANNLTASTFRSAQLDLLFVFNTEGKAVWGGVRTGTAESKIEEDANLEAELASTPAIVRQNSALDAASGVFLSKRGPIIVAALPILTNEGRGPSRGAFVMGRLLSDSLITALGDQAGVGLSVYPIPGAALAPDKAAVLAQITPSAPSVCRIKDARTESVFTVYPDIAHAPGLLLEADIQRDITPKGSLVARYTLLSSLSSGVLVLLSLVFALRKTVIVPIRSLTQRVMGLTIGEAPLSADAQAPGNEVTFLSTEFEKMKARLAADLELRRQSEARMRALLVSAPDGIVTVDRSGMIESLNPAAETMFGYAPGELTGKNWRTLVSEGLNQYDDATVAAAIRDKTASEGFIGYETGGLRKDGSVFPVHVTASEVYVGEERLFLAIMRDITELSRMHERVLRAEHLAAVGEMGASVAHEIKNPIAGISGAVQVLRDSLAPNDPRREVIAEILEQVSRVDLTVRELLMFAKPWSPEKRACDVRTLVRETIARAKTHEAYRRITFEEGGGAEVFALLDRRLIEHVLTNLFQNALQAMPEGGIIRCDTVSTADSAEISVTDTGTGMAAEVQKDVFRPFFTTRTRGTGLGLAVSRQIMEAHEGAISIDSRPGAGTRVTLSFPKKG